MKGREPEVHDTTQRLIGHLRRRLVLEWLNLGGCLRVWIRYGLPNVLVLMTLWLFGPVCVDSACEVPWPTLMATLLQGGWMVGLFAAALAVVGCCAVSPLPALLALVVWPLTFLVDVSLRHPACG